MLCATNHIEHTKRILRDDLPNDEKNNESKVFH